MFKVKLLPAAIVLSAALIVLGGCGTSTPAATDSAPKAEAAETAAPAPAPEPIKVGKVDYAAHGTKAFSVAFAAVQGDKIVGAFVDEYQLMAKAEATGVPNSDKDFGTIFKDDTQVLASKRTNTEYYSEHMKEKAGSTQHWDVNQDAIDHFAVGKTISELEDYLKNTPADSAPTDVVSGSTLKDSYHYLEAILAAAKAAK